MNELHLFAGAGGGILGGQLLGHRCVCAVEREPYAQAVLVARQNDGTFPPFPIWDDVCTFDGKPWRGIADVVCGGFPCQDISVAGNGAGLDGERSGLWSQMARIIGEVRPRYAFIENSPALVTRGLDRVLCDIAAMGFDARWGVVSAADTGAAHKRERIWILASSRRAEFLSHAELCGAGRREQQPEIIGETSMANARSGRLCGSEGREVEQPWRTKVVGGSVDLADAESFGGKRLCVSDGMRQSGSKGIFSESSGVGCEGIGGEDVANSNSLQGLGAEPQPRQHRRPSGLQRGAIDFPSWPADPADAPESGVGRVVDGMAHRSHRIKAIGNGQVSRVAAAAFSILAEQIMSAKQNFRYSSEDKGE